ncbi:peptidoglycan DD-metalloendopeptidase family protein [Flavobacterium sp. SUN052]|uniref:peptidoglycan DD-metalloendopeptidase family protein n=1 Tax=Flavobacterium sp. SUN052 TaxID=3002441 RepID=UPI00237D668D|nr:peptidoglycan DD-metalloendopeptidase family protein [Flavobacterium sp. SUN052]MEC4003141.1 peptidoglycan DD-metalloendopeptidase family protein [Flavobacterium sp. SUN052]
MSFNLDFFHDFSPIKVIAKEIDYSNYIAIDLSENNKELLNHKLETAHDYEIYIQDYLDKNNAKIAFGGYLETRNLYKRSAVFNNENSKERNIHIGLDLWINEEAPVYSCFDGEIHSFQNNTALGDYGPTIIIKHHSNNVTFYSLYGHLNIDCLKNLKIGQKIKHGEQIATLGLPPINGDYAPHLHFQIIIDIQNYFGDYPGVCSSDDLEFYSNNCPNPNLILKINN